MSTISPMQLRRTMSYPSQPFDESQGVDPGQLFTVDPWSLSPAGPGKKLHLDSLTAPETPMRKVRNHSVAVADAGLVTPQSVSRSFSTSALPFGQSDMVELGHALPSPMMTPLTTPLATPMDSNDNPLDLAFDKEGISIPLGMNANFNFDLGFAGHHSGVSTPERGLDDVDMAPGINPFYRPPLCLRRSPSVSDSDAAAAEVAAAAATPIGSLSPLQSEAGSLDSHDDISGDAASSAADAAAAAAAAAAAVGDPASPHELQQRLQRQKSQTQQHEQFDLKALMPPGAYGDISDLGNIQFRMDDRSPFMYPAAIQGNLPATKKTRSRSSSASSVSSQTGDVEKPFVCESCSKGFRRMEHLRRHMKTHTLERPYVCTVPDCGRKFSRSDNLKAHILTHAKKTGRNVYVEGLVETHKVKPIKRRKSKCNAQITA